MPIDRITPLAPVYVLLLGSILILALGPVLKPSRRHQLVIATGALATISLLFVGSRYPVDVQSVHVLAEWLGSPALAVRVPPFEPFLWVLMGSLLAISVAEQERAHRLSVVDYVVLLTLTAAGCGLVLAGNHRTLAHALLLFDGTAAIHLLVGRQPGHAVRRLLLGVLSSSMVIASAQGIDPLAPFRPEMGPLFSLIIWLRLGLYPLLEWNAPRDFLPPVRLGWVVVNLAVGLYLVSDVSMAWLVWLAGVTTATHGVLAWLQPGRDRALAHMGYALAGGILTMAVAGESRPVTSAAMSTLAAVVALGLTPSQLGRPDWSRPQRWWPYLPPLLATASLAGVPFTLGWEGRGALYQLAWEAGASGALALIMVAEGAALSALYRYWRRLMRNSSDGMEHLSGIEEAIQKSDGPNQHQSATEHTASTTKRGPDKSATWGPVGALLACVPFLIPVLGARVPTVVLPPPLALAPLPLSTCLGLVASLLWAAFLGYGRRRLLAVLPISPHLLTNILNLGWLLDGLGRELDWLGRSLLRLRAIIGGEHYLAWAILLGLSLGLWITLR